MVSLIHVAYEVGDRRIHTAYDLSNGNFAGVNDSAFQLGRSVPCCREADDDFEEAPQTLNFKGSMGRRVTPTSLELRLRETGYSARGLREPNCVEY